MSQPPRAARPSRILYLLYANPAAYPPLEHGSRILADSGWKIRMFGVASRGTETLRLPQHPNVRFTLWDYCPPGLKQKLHYLAFCSVAFLMALRYRNGWIYISDPMACPIGALLAGFGWNVAYHEHDFPDGRASEHSAFMRAILRARQSLARKARFCVVPNSARAALFKQALTPIGPVLSVMNCPARHEAAIVAIPPPAPFVIFYHGSIVPARVPLQLVRALKLLPSHVLLRIAGYQTIGHPDYVEELKSEAAAHGLRERIEYLGPIPHRADLLTACRRAHVGISLMPLQSSDMNEQTMAGASNKAFDYLACGVPILVSDLPVWKELFVTPGFALACDPNDPASIGNALRWFVEHDEQSRNMGKCGRQQVRRTWNYENQFLPVIQGLSHDMTESPVIDVGTAA